MSHRIVPAAQADEASVAPLPPVTLIGNLVDPTRFKPSGSDSRSRVDPARTRSRCMIDTVDVRSIRQCGRCRLFTPFHDIAQPGALDAWRRCTECRDLVFPRPEPDPINPAAT